jgi:hypothetical protein
VAFLRFRLKGGDDQQDDHRVQDEAEHGDPMPSSFSPP